MGMNKGCQLPRLSDRARNLKGGDLADYLIFAGLSATG